MSAKVAGRSRVSAARRALVLVPAAAFPVWAAQPAPAEADTTLTIEYVETHDRLDPDPKPGITVRHTLEATLSAGNHVVENDRREVGGRKRVFVAHGQNQGALGDNTAWATWRVIGPHQLERLFAGHGFLLKIDVETGPADACAVTVAYLLQAGFTSVMSRRADTGEPARISLPKVVSAQCSIR